MKKYKLSEICILKSGGTPRRGESFLYGGNIPWAKISDFDNSINGILYDTEETITEKGLKSINYRLFPSGTLLLAMYGSVGKVAIAGTRMSCNQAILGIESKKNDVLNVNYLKFWFQFNKSFIYSKGRGATQHNISATIVKNLEVKIPKLIYQNKVVAVLDKASTLINKRKEIINIFEKLCNSKFLELFELNLINFKKDSVFLSEIATITSGITLGRKTKETLFKVPYLRVANAQDGYFDLREIKYTKATKRELEKYSIKVNDILITEGGDPNKLGRGAIWEKEEDKYIFQNHLYRIRVSDVEKHSPVWLSTLFGSEFGKAYFRSQAKQTTGIASINKRQVSEFPIPFCSFEFQKEFENFYYRIKASKENILSSKEKLQTLFDSILQRAFSGQLNFNVDVDLDAILSEIDLLEEENDLTELTTDISFLQRFVDRLNNQEFENEDLYNKAKHAVFQLLKDENRIEQNYDKKSKSIMLKVK